MGAKNGNLNSQSLKNSYNRVDYNCGSLRGNNIPSTFTNLENSLHENLTFSKQNTKPCLKGNPPNSYNSQYNSTNPTGAPPNISQPLNSQIPKNPPMNIHLVNLSLDPSAKTNKINTSEITQSIFNNNKSGTPISSKVPPSYINVNLNNNGMFVNNFTNINNINNINHVNNINSCNCGYSSNNCNPSIVKSGLPASLLIENIEKPFQPKGSNV